MKRKHKLLTFCLTMALVLTMSLAFASCKPKYPGANYTIKQIDLTPTSNTFGEKYNSLFQNYLIDDTENYLGHPDTVLLKSGALMTMYPKGHGQGAVLTKTSADGGKTWQYAQNMPKSWEKSMETPTVYRLSFNDGSEKIVMISGHPQWWYSDTNKTVAGDGFNASFSNDDGQTWSEFEKFYGKTSPNYVQPIVAMSSLTRLKDANGNWQDAWMGFFHDHTFVNYKTILTFKNGQMNWSVPEPYFSQHRKIEQETQMCEVEVIRNQQNNGDQLCLITRSNSKVHNSMVSFSDDEGQTWSQPKFLPSAISGERFKADWLPDGRLFITFRSIERSKEKLKANKQEITWKTKWFSEGWIAWVGNYNDLVNGNEGQYRVKLTHTYYDFQTNPSVVAAPDTGYCGNAVLPDGKIFTSSYGAFSTDKYFTNADNKKIYKTHIIGKVLDINLLDQLARQL